MNVLQRVGGSIGTALLAVVLVDRIKAEIPHGVGLSGGAVKPLSPAVREHVAVPLAHAFSSTFWWAAALTAFAIFPAALLAVKVRPTPASSAPAGAAQAA